LNLSRQAAGGNRCGAMNMKLADQGLVSATKNAVSCAFGKGVALLDLRSNVYYSLNGVGAFIWELIQEPKPLTDVHKAVMARYDVDAARCRADVDRLLQDLAKASLVQLHDQEPV
jgi:hypothetical protein